MNTICSVIIPVYNCEKFIFETVESVRRQTIREIEIIILDDCSTDHSLELMKRMSEQDDRIKIFQNEINCGVANTRNIGIDLSSGQYIALLDGDDIWMPDKLEKQLNHMRTKGCRISYCSYGFMDQEGNPFGADFIIPASTNMKKILSNSVMSCSTVIAERELFLKHKFKTEFYHEDLVLWIDILKDCKISFGNPEVLATLRIMRGSRSGNKVKSAKQRWIIYRKYLNLSIVSSIYYYIIYVVLGLRKYWKLRKAL